MAVRQIKSDTPTRGIIEYTLNPAYPHWQPGVDFNEVHRLVVGPYDKPGIAASKTKERLNDEFGVSIWSPIPTKLVVEVRYEKVTEWEITSYEFYRP